ncbi:MAG: hypothetical protein EOP85_03135 [Verrucomicrobiaceae bacterium]|nr:MAG: hypothetical protein EOP85_03135 [Verrucomicrobiaceae bacterium]
MKLLPVILLSALFVSCASKPEPKRDASGNEAPEPFVPVSGQAGPTDIARFLAGRPVREGARLSELQQSGEYRAYSRDTLQKWKLRTSRRIGHQDAWQASNIAPLIGTPRTVLYPFGGPDLLYAMALFPNSSRYILLGLEPVGGLPDLENIEPASVIGSLPGHSKAVETQLLHGYFITKDMKTDFSNGAIQGVTPVLLSALGLMDAQVHSVSGTSAGGKSAVEIDFTLPGRGRKSVTYVSGDLSNGGFKGGYSSWLSSNASGSTAYFKAASYLMQDGSFTGIRNWVLSNCRSVVQDDSGIPYKAYDQQVWDLRLFGNYDGPISFFSKHAQADLKAAYDAAGPFNELTFGSGYEMTPSKANMMIAIRR